MDDRGQRLAVAVAPQGLVTSGVQLYHLPDGVLLHTLAHPKPVRCLDWSGELLAAGGSEDRLVHIWDTVTGRRLHRLSGHDAELESVRFRPRGQELVSVAQDSVLRVWHAGLGVELVRLEGLREHVGPAWWDAAGQRLHCTVRDTAQTDVFLCHWSPGTQVLSPGSDEPRSENIPSLSLSPDGALASTVDETCARLWSLRTGRVLATFPKDGSEWMTARLTGSGEPGLWLAGWNRALRSHPLRGAQSDWPAVGAEVHTQQNSGPLLVASRSDGGALALTNAGSNTGDQVQVWLNSERRLLQLNVPKPYCAALSPDGHWLVTGSFTHGGAALWNLAEARQVRALPHPGVVLGMSFTQNGSRLWLWGDRSIQQIDTITWQPLGSIHNQVIQALAVSADGRLMAGTSRNEVVLYSASDLREIARLPVPAAAGPVGTATVVFSEKGDDLGLHTANGTLIHWQLPVLAAQLAAMGLDAPWQEIP